jgi:hypothetical protein
MVDEPQDISDLLAILDAVSADLYRVKNRDMIDVRGALWDRGHIEASMAVDTARNEIAKALHALRRCYPKPT